MGHAWWGDPQNTTIRVIFMEENNKYIKTTIVNIPVKILSTVIKRVLWDFFFTDSFPFSEFLTIETLNSRIHQYCTSLLTYILNPIGAFWCVMRKTFILDIQIRNRVSVKRTKSQECIGGNVCGLRARNINENIMWAG